MSVDTVLGARLAGFAGLVALVGTKIYAPSLPQGDHLPAVTYRLVDGTREQGMTADHGMAHPRFQVDCWAETYAAVKAIADQVRLALERWSDGTTAPVILDCFSAGERDLPEPEAGLQRISMDFVIWHRE